MFTLLHGAMLFITATILSPQVFSQSCNYGVVTNLQAKTSTILLYKTWSIYFNQFNAYAAPVLYTLRGTDTVYISNSCVTWTVADTAIAHVNNGVLTAKNSGNTSLVASLAGNAVSINLQVPADDRPIEYENALDPFLTTPAPNAVVQVPVVVICYIPTYGGYAINNDEAGYAPIPQQNVDELKKWITAISKHAKFSLEEGSKFRGYKDPAAVPYLGYKIIDYIYVYEPVPRGLKDPGSAGFFGDYNNILNRFNSKRYVDTLGVKEFWIMGYHHGEIVPVESNMASPTTGDISNSYRYSNDMPVYSKTYVLYNYNYTRSGNEATHNHGHQIESMVDFVAQLQDGNTSLFTRNFRGYTGGSGPLGRVGDTHHPPNTNVDYDYYNNTPVASDILDWKPEGGTQSMVNAATWTSIPYNWPQGTVPDGESNWYIFWMQSLPGFGNQIPYNTKRMTNWWEFLGNWDISTARLGLYRQNTTLPVTLVSLDAVNRGSAIELTWKTAYEEHLLRFEVERSSDGHTYIHAGSVAAVRTGTGIRNYTYTDVSAWKGKNYYRLKIVDEDGKISYSATVTAPVFSTAVAVFPNPATASVTVWNLPADEETHIQLIDMGGRMVLSRRIRQASAVLDIREQPAGVYMLKIITAGKVLVKKIVKKAL